MQTMVSYLDGEWESICKLLTVEEQPDVSADMFECISPSCFSYKNSYPSFQLFPENLEKGSHENLSSQNDAVNSTYESGCFLDFPALNDISLCFDFPMNGEMDGLFGLKFLDPERNETISTDEGSSLSTLDTDQANNLISAPSPDLSLKRKPDAPVSQDEDMFLLATPKKKARIRRTAQNRKTKAEAKAEEASAQSETVEEESEARQRQSIRCDNSEDESNESEESYQAEDSESNKSFIITSTGKKRASRGAATDPQSLYARRRRMRINERLRILQSLVPNGTKVDISTMLDEAFHYVKFLQLQIRLLSSDDLWMYAPLAYNGYDATVYKRMSPFLGLP